MQEPKSPPKIHVPEGVTESGMIDNISEATARASLAVPALLQAIVEALEDLSLDLHWIQTCMFRKCKEDGLFTPEEIEEHDKQMESLEDGHGDGQEDSED